MNALSRPEIKVGTDKHRMQLLLKLECFDPQINAELALVDDDNSWNGSVVEYVMDMNKSAESLEHFQVKASEGEDGRPWSLTAERTLCHEGKLIVPTDEDLNLPAKLIKAIHEQASVAHLGKKKTPSLMQA